METVCVRFYEELNDFLPRARRKRTVELPLDRRCSVKDLVESLGVPHTEVDLILVDGVSVGFDHPVRAGERIAVYPRFESFDVSGVQRLRPQPLRTPRFVCDVHLGKLARNLRLLGFDTVFDPAWDDAELAELAATGPRILLTRDRQLLKRSIVTHGYCVRHDDAMVQVREVLDRLDLHAAVQPLGRCLRCNGTLEPVEKAAILDRLEPLTRRYYDEFRRCTACDGIFWRGSHFRKLERRLAAWGLGAPGT